jgi:hypothetical protein
VAAESFIEATDKDVTKLIAEKKYRELRCEGAQP